MKKILPLFLVLGLTAAAAERIDLGAGRAARLTLPANWEATKGPESQTENSARAVTVRYATKDGSNDAVLITLLPMPDELLADPALLRELVELSTHQFIDASVERKAYLKEIKVAGKTGYACLFTDAALVGQPVRKDDYKTITICFVYLGDSLLLAATIFSDDPSAPAFAEARRLVQSLTVSSPQKAL
jgi:hypothetical protein